MELHSERITTKQKTAGGTVALDKMDVPHVGTVAYFKDPDGNLFGMIQPIMPVTAK